MSKNIFQVYTANPITSNTSTDLMYFGQSPYGIGNDAAMTFGDFANQFGDPYTPSALTRTNDTNVTLTLGGTPATSLLQSVSLTMGWTGQLSSARGGTGVNNGTNTLTLAGNLATSGAFASTFTMTGVTNVTFPTSGTIATTSQIPSVTPSALTKIDDTNVTLTLGGTPATALLQATSLTLGWTGSLAVVRGGLGITTTPTNGQIPIGNGTNYTAATLTAGTGMSITNAAGSISLSTTAFTQVVIQVFSANGTYTPTSGMKYCIVEAIGGGGGGGGCQTTSSVQVAAAGGGGGGAYQRSVFTAATIGASKAVVIGAGGAAGSAGNNNGSAGGATTLGTTLLVANGGSGGVGGAATGTSATSGGGAAGGVGTGTVFIGAEAGQAGVCTYNATTYNSQSGAGGNSHFGYGGKGIFRIAISGANNTGNNATGWGGGGSGASNTISCADTAGGFGRDGYLIITEYI